MASAALDRVFAALADPTRRGVVDRLRQRDQRAGELAEALAVSPQALSRHLRILRQCDLVEELTVEHDARVRLYRLRREQFQRLRAWVDQVEVLWQDQLTAFAAHVARTRGKGRRA